MNTEFGYHKTRDGRLFFRVFTEDESVHFMINLSEAELDDLRAVLDDDPTPLVVDDLSGDDY